MVAESSKVQALIKDTAVLHIHCKDALCLR
jgi:hypothetical protein